MDVDETRSKQPTASVDDPSGARFRRRVVPIESGDQAAVDQYRSVGQNAAGSNVEDRGTDDGKINWRARVLGALCGGCRKGEAEDADRTKIHCAPPPPGRGGGVQFGVARPPEPAKVRPPS